MAGNLTRFLLTVSVSSVCLFVVNCSQVKPDEPIKTKGLTYRELMLKDYDEMEAIVKRHIKDAHVILATSDSDENAEFKAKAELLRATRTVFSRPNSDNMVAKLAAQVKSEANTFTIYDDLLESLTKEGIEAFDPKLKLPTDTQTTSLFMLENLMSEFKPEISQNERERACLEQIRDAKIAIPRKVMAERKLSSMFLGESPSDTAKRILEAAGFKKKK
jgi:hypothetical protein